jgi:choice-of-anchor A domain-containing protein
LAASAVIGGVQAATAEVLATSSALVAGDACPATWPGPHAGPPSGAFDGNVSVLVGGNLRVAGSAAGAEGTVVALGDALFARDLPGSYQVGVTAVGSQVTPYAGSDMLVVGGNLGATLGTHVDVGSGLGGDVVVGGAVAAVTDLDPHGQTVDQAVAGATAPYLDLVGQLAPMSAAYAALPDTGSAEVTDGAVTLTGDGTSSVQVFTVDGAAMATQTGPGRSLQLLGVPQDAAVVVNLTGPAVDVDVDSLLTPDGATVDPQTDPYFAQLATHLLWNAPSANSVAVRGLAQLPGSLLVPSAPSTTTLSGSGTNGRILVAGDLVHTGSGELHSYPFLRTPQWSCAADPVHLTTLSLGVQLVDPERVVERDHVFEGEFGCVLGGVDVTPADHTWKLRAGTSRQLSDQIPAGAVCTVVEQLTDAPAPFRAWAAPVIDPEVQVVEKRRNLGFTIVNKVKKAAPPPETATADPTPTPTASPSPTESSPEPPETAPETPSSSSSETPTSVVEPTDRPALPSSPSAQPTAAPSATETATEGTEAPSADAPHQGGPAGPLTTTAPFTLRGAFVWAPMLMLSVLTLLLRVRRRPKRLH